MHSIHHLHKENNLRSNARWDCPPKGCYKVNFDGTSKGNPGIVGCGIIIRDENGYSNGAMEIPIGNQTNHIEEASTSLHGLFFSKNKNLEKIWLEGDSLNIINCLNKVTTRSWTIKNIILKAINIINSFGECVITHSYREANMAANWTASMACKNQMKIVWNNGSDIPIEGSSLMEYDQIGSK